MEVLEMADPSSDMQIPAENLDTTYAIGIFQNLLQHTSCLFIMLRFLCWLMLL